MPNPEFPDIPEQMLGLARDTLLVLQHAADERKVLTTPEIATNRLDICDACPKLFEGRCVFCACHMNVKVNFAAFKCPLGKW